MSHIVIEPTTSRRVRKAFLQLPWDLYAADPLWIPPLRMHQKEATGLARHPFYQRNEAERFVAYRGGRPVGRIAAILNKDHNARYDAQDGFFGFFECIEDHEVAQALFARAWDWLAERGMQTMRGPTNPSLNYEIGSLVEGFDSPPVFMMTYNPAYHADLYATAGLQKLKDALAFYGHVDMLATIDKKLTFIGEEVMRRFNLNIRSMDRGRFAEEVQTFLQLYNTSLVSTWGFVPYSDEEVRHTAKGLKQLVVPELAVVAEIEGNPIGVMFALPDYNPRIRAINGRLFPFGFLKLLRNRRGIERVRVISANVVPEYQSWGVPLAMLGLLKQRILEFGIEEAEFSWVLEDNNLSRRSLEHGGAKHYKTYRLYECQQRPGTAQAAR